jgi:hypothetical protein
MNWAATRRLDFIDWRLAARGEVRRADIVRVFGVSVPQASIDLSAFTAEHPGSMRYDTHRKCYVRDRGSRCRAHRYDAAWEIEDRIP